MGNNWKISLSSFWQGFKIVLLGILLVILFPLLVSLIFFPSARNLLVKLADKLLSDSKKKDEDFKKQAESIRNEIKESEAKIKNIDDKIIDIAKKRDANWHKQYNKNKE